MLTKKEAADLRALIEDYREDAISNSWKGTMTPEDARITELEFEVSTRKLNDFINNLEK